METSKALERMSEEHAALVKTVGGGAQFSPGGHQNQTFRVQKLLLKKRMLVQ